MDESIPTAKDLGEMVRQTRKEQGLTQDDLAGMSGVGRRFVSDLENGKETSQLGKVLLILGVLGLALYAFNKWKK